MGPMRTYLVGVAMSALATAPAMAQRSADTTPHLRIEVGIRMSGGFAKDSISTPLPTVLVMSGRSGDASLRYVQDVSPTPATILGNTP